MRLATCAACGGGGGGGGGGGSGAVMVVGSGSGGGARGVVVLVVVVLVVVLGGEGRGCGGERLPRSPSHARALQNTLPSAPSDMKPDVLSRYPGQDDYISKYSRASFIPSLPFILPSLHVSVNICSFPFLPTILPSLFPISVSYHVLILFLLSLCT
ncbi:hypothetical protein E2C01_081611 [Portunus trituberculatus]|uniref:Uncharacterized protein n=1 Tax=Portunus trituberculatus TaxID=210409 RepID=A0A5B7IWC3_PORTR|nr:hypothetical protein [Portunus trituberculatus]